MGQNCLHICLINYRRLRERVNLRDHLEILLLLVRNGADINAIDNSKQSVSMFAYSDLDGYYWHRSGCWGDLWDRVLAESGHNLSERRRDFPRRPQYSEIYSRDDFEEIWQGWESSCPYYDDPPEWPSKEIIASHEDEQENTGPSRVQELD